MTQPVRSPSPFTQIGNDTGVEGEVFLPPVVASRGEKVTTDGIYLLDNGVTFMMYFGVDVDRSVLTELFGTADISQAHATNFNCDQLSGALGSQ